jgi:WD40 repeat protein
MLGVAVWLTGAGIGPLSSVGQVPRTPETGPAQARADLHGDPLPAGALARLGTTRLRHGADITFLGFGPDGTTLLTASRDNTLRLWDLATGKEIRRFAPPKRVAPKGGKGAKEVKLKAEAALQMMMGGGNAAGRVTVALAPDGKTLAVAADNALQLWEVATGKEIRTIQGPQGGLVGLLFSPDGRTLAGRAPGGSLFLWAADTGQTIRQIKPAPRKAGNVFVLNLGGRGPDAPNMAFTPDSKMLAASATDEKEEGPAVRLVKFWDVATGKEVRKIEAPRGVSGVALAPSGKLLAHGGGGVIRLCEVATGKEVRQLKAPGRGILTLAFSPDGKWIAARARDGQVHLWDTETGKEVRQLGTPEAPPPPPQLAGAVAFVGGNFGSAPEVRVLAISPDGKRIASAAGNTVRIWETATGKELPLLGGHRQPPSALVLSPDGKTVLSWGGDQVVRRWDAATGRQLGEFPGPARTTRAAFAPDGRTAAFASADKTIRIHETATGKELRRLSGIPGNVTALGFAPGGKVLAARHGDNTIRLYDVVKGVELLQITLRPGGKQAPGNVIVLGGPRGRTRGPGLAFSPDGALLVAPRPGGSGSLLALFDTTTGKELRRIESPQRVAGFAFSPDGRILATENADRTVTLWEVASAKERGRLGKPAAQRRPPDAGMGGFRVVLDGMALPSGEPSSPVGLTFSPDGRSLAARAPDLSVRVWDVDSGKELRQFKGHSGGVEVVAFAPNGKTLVSGATDTTVLLWDSTALRKELQAPLAEELSARDLEALWGDLAGADGVRAFQAVRRLAGASGQAVPFLRRQVKPAVAIAPEKIAGWIADLQSEKFGVRARAAANLLKAGEQAVPALQKLRGSPPSLETRSRVESLLDKLTGGTLTPEQLRLTRAVEALERMGSPEARALLRTLAGGVPGTLTTREAEAALGRLGRAP